MKISRSDSNHNTAKIQPASAVGPGSVAPAPTPNPPSGAPTDQVELSALSKYLAAALSGSPEHAAKLAGLTSAISTGTYLVDAFKVSASIIQHSIEFGGSAYRGLVSLST
ncbi:MAG TPA: flagellar biosynthesis anti-sigma factor FlgM [Bryobacteraceae bacterium]|nr:flagellar biosynthesis anti-sigma factor FlgM [Bryobacteraceae bacterium]